MAAASVVTAIEYDLIELPEVFAGSAIYPADERTSEIVSRYSSGRTTSPVDVTSIVRFLHLPPLPMIPEPLQDRPLITIGACYAGPESRGPSWCSRCASWATRSWTRSKPCLRRGYPRHMEPEEPVPGLIYTTSLREAPQAAVDAFIDTAGPESGSPLLSAELRQCGGAVGQPAEGGGRSPTSMRSMCSAESACR